MSTNCLLSALSRWSVADGLREAHLEMSDGDFRSSQEATVDAAITVKNLPETAEADFSTVNFLNVDDWTSSTPAWPIVYMTYVYVRKDLTRSNASPREQALLFAFLRALYDSTYVQRCVDEYGFTAVANIPEVRAFALNAVEELETSVAAMTGQELFVFELNTIPIVGASDYVFSTKRKEVADVERQDITDRVEQLEINLADALALLEKYGRSIEQLERNPACCDCPELQSPPTNSSTAEEELPAVVKNKSISVPSSAAPVAESFKTSAPTSGTVPTLPSSLLPADEQPTSVPSTSSSSIEATARAPSSSAAAAVAKHKNCVPLLASAVWAALGAAVLV